MAPSWRPYNLCFSLSTFPASWQSCISHNFQWFFPRSPLLALTSAHLVWPLYPRTTMSGTAEIPTLTLIHVSPFSLISSHRTLLITFLDPLSSTAVTDTSLHNTNRLWEALTCLHGLPSSGCSYCDVDTVADQEGPSILLPPKDPAPGAQCEVGQAAQIHLAYFTLLLQADTCSASEL